MVLARSPAGHVGWPPRGLRSVPSGGCGSHHFQGRGQALKARAPNGKSCGTGRWRHRAYEGPEVPWLAVKCFGGVLKVDVPQLNRNLSIIAMAPRPESVEESGARYS